MRKMGKTSGHSLCPLEIVGHEIWTGVGVAGGLLVRRLELIFIFQEPPTQD